MSRLLERKSLEWVTWYFEHRGQIPESNFTKRLDFQEKAIEGLLDILSICTRDIQDLEHRRSSSSLWTPPRIRTEGDARKFAGDPKIQTLEQV